MWEFHKIKRTAGCIAAALGLLLLPAACSHGTFYAPEKYNSDRNDKNNTAVKIGYFGRTEEIPLFAALEKGFFKNGGIDAELIKIQDKDLVRKFNSGELDAVTADYRFFKYLEDGLPVRLTAGLNAGCFRIIVRADSPISNINDLKGIRMGSEGTGDGTMVLAYMLLKGNGIDPAEEVQWEPLGENNCINALEKGDIDAACIWEPAEKNAGLIQEKYRTVYANSKMTAGSKAGGGHNHGSGTHFTRAFTGISRDLIEKHPEKAVYITKAWLEGSLWASENVPDAVKLAIDKGYVKDRYEDSLDLLSAYMWTNGAGGAKPNIKFFIQEQKAMGILEKSLDEEEFYKKVFAGIMPEFY